MRKYIVTDVSAAEMRKNGIQTVSDWSAYLVENNVVTSCTDRMSRVLQWMEDGAIWIKDDLSKLPKPLHYDTTAELMRNDKNIVWQDLTSEEQERFAKRFTSSDEYRLAIDGYWIENPRFNGEEAVYKAYTVEDFNGRNPE